MDLSKLKQQAVAVPFTPFTVFLRDGRKSPVSRRNQLAVSPLSTYFVVEDQAELHRLDVALIDRVEVAQTIPAH